MNPTPSSIFNNLTIGTGRTLTLNGGGLIVQSRLFCNGTINLPVNTILTLQAPTYQCSIQGTGTQNYGGKIRYEGGANITGTIRAATLNINGEVEVLGYALGFGGANASSIVTVDHATFNIASGATCTANASGYYSFSNTTISGAGKFSINGNSFSYSTLSFYEGMQVDVHEFTMNYTQLEINNSITFNNTKFTIQFAGKMCVADATLFYYAGAETWTNDGIIGGYGTVEIAATATFTNNGSIAPGCSPGTLTLIVSNYINNILDIELSENNSVIDYDVLSITGNITLQNTLNVSEITGNIPSGNYTIITASGSISGTFSSVNLPPGYVVVYHSNSVVLVKSALPLELLSFAALKRPKTNEITWITASEHQVDYHLLERSPDGISRWTALYKVAAYNDAGLSVQYRYEDEQPLPQSFYRLRSVDFDGTTYLSGIEQVYREITGFSVSNVYPLPVTDMLTISYYADREADLLMRLTDMTGRIVLQKTGTTAYGAGQAVLSLQELPAGQYYLKISTATHVGEVIPVVKQ